jgi:hypothetical protein
MAKLVGYRDDNVTFDCGPFVLTNPLGNGYRLECQIGDSGMPVLPDSSVYELLRKNGLKTGKWWSLEGAATVCDWLNDQVKSGVIKQADWGGWVA